MILKAPGIKEHTLLGKNGLRDLRYVQTFESIYISIYFILYIHKIDSCRYKTQITYLSLYTYVRETNHTYIFLYNDSSILKYFGTFLSIFPSKYYLRVSFNFQV